MNKLNRVLILVSCYGFLKYFKPTEPYLYEFEHVTLNISGSVLSAEVYPIWTYTYLVALIPVFLLTDVLLYKPIVMVEAISLLLTWILFDVGKSVLSQQIIEFLYGCGSAAEVAYFAYIYVAVDRENYKRATTVSRGAIQGGKFFSYFISQLIIGLKWGDYYLLNYISTGSLVLATISSILLPMVSWRKAYERRFPVQDGESPKDDISYGTFVKSFTLKMWSDAVDMYSNAFILKWSIWWALASCVDLQVSNYAQTLWGSVQTEDTQYNGITEALVPLIALPVVVLMERVSIRWHLWGESILAVLSIADAGILLLMALTPSIFVMYGGYIAYRVLYEAMIAITQFNLASHLYKDSFGLLFGMNTFIAVLLQTILTLVVADKNGLHLPIQTQFYVYSGCHVVIAVIFTVAAIFTFVKLQRLKKEPIVEHEEDDLSVKHDDFEIGDVERF